MDKRKNKGFTLMEMLIVVAIIAILIAIAIPMMRGQMHKTQVAADIAKTAIRTGASVKDVLISRNLLTEEEINKLLDPYAMT